jgi:hypothetical protein
VPKVVSDFGRSNAASSENLLKFSMPSYKVLQHFFTVIFLVNIIISCGFVKADAEAESRQVSD